MLLKYFYDHALAHASYLVGCQRTGEAIVIDPARSVDQYLATAASEGVRIVGSAETHIHADFVSGSCELADRAPAVLYLSDEGGGDWKYTVAARYPANLLKQGSQFHIGHVRFDVMHTPGHTPESISLILTDEGSGATAPMGIFTGDFVFVGSVGRPDLLETAAGIVGSAEVGARQLFHSLARFRQLPDYLQVWPAHGAGSACGKGLGAVPSSTVGYEKLFNPALQLADEQEFVDYILADQPETPFYFAVMKRVNKNGPTLLRDLPAPTRLDPSQLPSIAGQSLVIDTTASAEFAAAHVPGTVNIPSGGLVRWAGFLVDYDQPTYLVTDLQALPAELQRLRSIGVDNIAGVFDARQVRDAGLRSESYRRGTPADLHELIDRRAVTLVDVRTRTEFEAGHIPQAEHHFLGRLTKEAAAIDSARPVVVQCLSGGRSAIAASILQRAGLEVTNMEGGIRAWSACGLPVSRPAAEAMPA